jgi:hypothetical protein
MIGLERSDFEESDRLAEIAAAVGKGPIEFESRFRYLVAVGA